MGRQLHRVALFGYPLGHSVSPAMHHAAAEALGIELSYEPCPVQAGALPEAFGALRSEPWLGANVTLPHKPAVAALVDALTSLAHRIGAVNTVYKRDGRLVGENTDAPALVRCLRESLALQPLDERALVIGAGGAARAALIALLDAGVRSVTIWNRTCERATALAASVAGHDAASGGLLVVDDAALPQALAQATLVVNATSVGLDGESTPLADLPRTQDARLFDLVYGPDGTPLVRQARRYGWHAQDGLWMLVYQAALAFELWTGMQPPERIMYD
ncbi:MAG TPA: shikimate dehydrogenase, partial [Chloroflexota bacterium]|nr:shikimate dehydrogenase [Chloroflexota bacterium]